MSIHFFPRTPDDVRNPNERIMSTKASCFLFFFAFPLMLVYGEVDQNSEEHSSVDHCWSSSPYGYGSIPIHTIFRGRNIDLPAILMFTRGIGFGPIPISPFIKSIVVEDAWVFPCFSLLQHVFRGSTSATGPHGHVIDLLQLLGRPARDGLWHAPSAVAIHRYPYILYI